MKKYIIILLISSLVSFYSCEKEDETVKKEDIKTEQQKDNKEKGKKKDDSKIDENKKEDNTEDKEKEEDNTEDKEKEEDKINTKYKPTDCHLIAFEFTGQYCYACPAEAKKMKTYKNAFKEKFLYIAMHPSSRGSQQLYCKDASIHFNNLVSLGKFRRELPNTSFNSLGSYSVPSNISEYDLAHGESNLAFNTKITHKKRDISVEFAAIACEDKKQITENKKINVLMWVIQNNIKTAQYVNSSWDRNYIHHYVLRGSINGTWGEPYTLGSVYKATNKKIPTEVFDITNKEAYLLVLVIDNDTKQVYGAAQYPLTNW